MDQVLTRYDTLHAAARLLPALGGAGRRAGAGRLRRGDARTGSRSPIGSAPVCRLSSTCRTSPRITVAGGSTCRVRIWTASAARTRTWRQPVPSARSAGADLVRGGSGQSAARQRRAACPHAAACAAARRRRLRRRGHARARRSSSRARATRARLHMEDAENGGRAMTVAAIELEYAYRECEQITRREAANFYYGIRLLPRSKRQAMCAAYAFARRVDDIGDDGGLDRGEQLEQLALERSRIAALAEGARPTGDPVMTALAHAHRALRPAGRRARAADRGRRAGRARRRVPELRRARALLPLCRRLGRAAVPGDLQ